MSLKHFVLHCLTLPNDGTVYESEREGERKWERVTAFLCVCVCVRKRQRAGACLCLSVCVFFKFCLSICLLKGAKHAHPSATPEWV